MSSTGRVPLLDENDRFPDRFAPPSVAADAAAAEVARAGSVAAASGAEAARDESVAAAERAEAVPAQVDTAMAEQVGTGGEFDTKLNATIATGLLITDPRFGGVMDGVTDGTAALVAAHAALPARGGKIIFPPGQLLISDNLVFTKNVILEGFNAAPTANVSGSAIVCAGASSITLKQGGSGARNLAIVGKAGNTGPGLIIHAERFQLENVTTIGHGGHGLVIGDGSTYYNVNSGYMANVRSKANGGDGIWIGCVNKTSPDANAITAVNLDLAENAGNGMTLDGTIDNTFIGFHSERNDGWGVQLIEAVSHFFSRTYIEFNDLGTLTADANSIYNYIMGGRRDDSFQLYEFANPQNLVLGRDFTNGLFPFQTRGYFGRLGVSARDISGQWEFTQNATNRNLEIVLAGTSASSAVQIRSSGAGKVAVGMDSLRVGTMDATHGIQQILRMDASLAFGTIPAGGTVEKEKSLAGAVVGDVVTVSPKAVPPAGVMWSAYVSAPDVVTVRLANVTAAAVTPGNIGFKGTVTRLL